MPAHEALSAEPSPTTLSTAFLPSSNAPSTPPAIVMEYVQGIQRGYNEPVWIESNLGSTAKGIMIGIFSVLGAAALVVFIAVIVYFFRYTQQGRILLDRIGRPGEYDDEQAFAKEEAEALEEMDDIQRMEYLRAKGTTPRASRAYMCLDNPKYRNGDILTFDSFCASKPGRIRTHRHIFITIPCHTREGRIGMGVRARVRDSKLLCRRSDRDRVFRLRVQRSEQPTGTKAE
jgi:hypothetical protein